MKGSTFQLKLTEPQLKIILESLLFHSSVDANSRWGKDECESSVKLASDLRKTYPKVLTENLYIFKDTIFHDTLTEKIVDLFPETLENNPNL